MPELHIQNRVYIKKNGIGPINSADAAVTHLEDWTPPAACQGPSLLDTHPTTEDCPGLIQKPESAGLSLRASLYIHAS